MHERHTPARLLLVCCAISFACFTCSYLRIPVLPLYAASLGADAARIGLINASFMLTAGLLSIPSGLLSDRIGRRRPILGGLLILSGSSLLLYLCRTPLQLGLVYLCFGVGLAAVAPTLMSYVADITPATHLGRAYGWYTMALYAGMTVGPAAGGLLGGLLGLGQVFLVSGVLLFLLFMAATLLLPSPPVTHPGDRPLRMPFGQQAALLGRNRRYLACLIATLGNCAGFGVFVSFFPLYAREAGLDSSHIGLVFAAQALANALSRFPFGRLGDRVADRSGIGAAGLVIFAVMLPVPVFCNGLPPLIAAAALLGVGMGIAYTAIGALIAQVVPAGQRGMAMGGYNSCIYLGMMCGSAVTGLVIRSAGFRWGFAGSGAIGLLTAMLFVMLNRWRKPA